MNVPVTILAAIVLAVGVSAPVPGLEGGALTQPENRAVLHVAQNTKDAKTMPNEDEERVPGYTSDREDGRFVSSLGISHAYMRSLKQQLAFDPNMTPKEFPVWQEKVRTKLRELMGFPDVPPQPAPKRLWAKERDGYTLEKWEVYPEPASVVPILVLVPNNSSAEAPSPAVLCFPGSSGTKEYLANEPEIYPGLKVAAHEDKNRMALYYAQAGMVAVAVDHPCTGETLERHGETILSGSQRDKLTRDLVYMGRNFVGLSAFQKMKVLDWVKTLPNVDPKRIALSGHSLGTEPAMVMAVLDPDVCAVVNNDFVHGKCEQDLALAPTMDGKRLFMTGGMWHLIPGIWQWFDLDDLLCAMAPRPLLAPEGGVAASLANLRKAYELAGAPENLTVYHFPKYDSPEKRPHDAEPIPEGLHIDEYYKRGNTDPPNHYFKGHLAVPWLSKTLGVADAK